MLTATLGLLVTLAAVYLVRQFLQRDLAATDGADLPDAADPADRLKAA